MRAKTKKSTTSERRSSAAKSPKTPRNHSLSKGEATRDRIREAVVQLVSRYGVSKIGLHDICEEAGITHGGFYFHFRNKEDAMVDVATHWISEFKQSVLDVPASEDLHEELFAMIVAYLEGYTRRLELTRLVYELDPLHPEVRDAFSAYQTRWWSRLAALAARHRKASGLSTGGEHWIAQCLTASLEGVCVHTYLVGLKELVADGTQPDVMADRMSVLWFRMIMGRDPNAQKKKRSQKS